MPTNYDVRQMSPLVKRLYNAITRERNLSCLAEQINVEQAIFAYGYAIGVEPSELLREWQGQPTRRSEAAAKRTSKPKPDDDLGPDDGDEMEQTTRICDACRGTGVGKDGSTCEECGGSGRVPLDAPDDNDDDNDDGEEAALFSKRSMHAYFGD
jgi:hypothetical protein